LKHVVIVIIRLTMTTYQTDSKTVENPTHLRFTRDPLYSIDMSNDSSDLESQYKATYEYNIKTDFLRKIYSLLSIQLAITFGVSLAFYKCPSINNFVIGHPNAFYIVTICTFIFLFLAMPCCYGQHHPVNLFILLGFTLCESYSIGYLCLFYTSSSIIICWGLTLSTFVCLSIYAYRSKTDFSFLGAGLYSCLWVLILGGLIQGIFLPASQFLNTSFAVLGAMVAIGYILYDTSEIINKLSPDEYVFACISLYIDILMLFTRLLELFGTRRD